MDNISYIALSRQTALFRQMDVIANNVANADTNGYRAEAMQFNPYNFDIGNRNKGAWTQDIATVTKTTQGEMVKTSRQLDVAINGDGFFVVTTPLGTRYTRAGNFTRAADGRLITPAGYEVQGEGGQPILLQENDINVTIHGDGTVTSGEGNEERGKLSLVKFDNPQEVKKTGNGLYTTTATATPDSESRIAQGVLEKSNVVSVQEITNMIEVQRGVGSTANMMKDSHDLSIRTIQTITKQ